MPYAFLLQETVSGLLLKEGMSFQLIHGGFYLVVQEQVLETFAGETRNPDGTNPTFLVKPFHRPPGSIIIAIGLVNQIKVEIIQSQLLHGQVKSP